MWLYGVGNPILSMANRFKNILLRRKWRRLNAHNDVHLKEGALFYRQVSAGRYSYGRISVVMFNTVDRLLIGDFVSIANGVRFLIGGDHCIENLLTFPVDTLITKKFAYRDVVSRGGITIGDDVWIGTNAIILGGVKVGQGAIIGAGAVVAKDIPSYAVVVGNPARVVKYRFSEDLIQKMLKIDFSKINESFLSSNLPLLYSEDMNESVDQILKILGKETPCIE